MALFQSFTLVNADLDAQYCKTFTHNKNTTNIDVEWWDNNGVKVTTAGVFDILDANSFTICTGAPITGTHSIKMVYSDNAVLGGTRLFADLPFDTDFLNQAFDTASVNMAYGNDTGSFNVTLEDFITKCQTPQEEGALIAINNLNDLQNPATARGNLDVYSKTEVNNKFLPTTETLPTLSDIGTWDLIIFSYSFMGAKPGIQNVVYGTMDISFMVKPENTVIAEGQWVTIFKTALVFVPYGTHVFFGQTSTGEKCMCRLLGTTYYDVNTAQIETTAQVDKGKMQVWFIDQVESEYYFNTFYHVGNYNG